MKRVVLKRELVFLSGRSVGKSTSMAALGLILHAIDTNDKELLDVITHAPGLARFVSITQGGKEDAR